MGQHRAKGDLMIRVFRRFNETEHIPYETIFFYCRGFLLIQKIASFIHSIPFHFIDLFVRSLVQSLSHCFIHALSHSLFHSTHSFMNSWIHSFIHSFIQSFISFIYSFIHSFIHSLPHSLTHSFIHSVSQSVIHSFIHSIARSSSHSIIQFNHWCILYQQLIPCAVHAAGLLTGHWFPLIATFVPKLLIWNDDHHISNAHTKMICMLFTR